MGGSWLRNAADALTKRRTMPGSDPSSSSGKWLALVPLVVAIVLGALLVPHATPPDAIPLPAIDTRAIARIADEDRALAAKARTTPLAAEIRAVGSALRAFYTLQSGDEHPEKIAIARAALDKSVLGAAPIEGGLAELRAVQLEEFLGAVRDFERTGIESDELKALGGGFVRRMRSAGWCVGNKVHLSEIELRAMYKAMWNSAVNAQASASLAPKMDETRVLYALYLRSPHPSEAARDVAAAQRKAAHDQAACARIADSEILATESWRLEKIQRLGAVDPSYPAAFAMGVAQFRMRKYHVAAQSFRTWLDAHPDGAWSSRARDHLVAATEAELRL